ncbi:MAG: hypothetical protein J4F37_13545, partial [Acidobacteria bacterium]|nr:hypothetical protein [Acidobacteriota bacterium]
MEGLAQVVVNRVAAVDGAGILLPRDQRVAVALEAAGRPPGGLPEVRPGNVAHLQQVGDVHVLGCHLRPGVLVTNRVALDVDVGVAGVPAAARLIDVTLEGNRDARRL